MHSHSSGLSALLTTSRSVACCAAFNTDCIELIELRSRFQGTNHKTGNLGEPAAPPNSAICGDWVPGRVEESRFFQVDERWRWQWLVGGCPLRHIGFVYFPALRNRHPNAFCNRLVSKTASGKAIKVLRSANHFARNKEPADQQSHSEFSATIAGIRHVHQYLKKPVRLWRARLLRLKLFTMFFSHPPSLTRSGQEGRRRDEMRLTMYAARPAPPLSRKGSFTPRAGPERRFCCGAAL